MSFFFRSGALYSKIKIRGVVTKEYEALVDTGAAKTGIPVNECQKLGLRASGIEWTEGLFGGDYLPLFESKIEFAGKVLDKNIVGLPIHIPIIGRDLIRHLKMTLDWRILVANVEDP
ncbi:MAG: hypothetical protein ACPLYF_03655 [Fervidobacterium sp.]